MGRTAVALDRFRGTKIRTYPELFETLDLLARDKNQDVTRVFCTLNEFSNAHNLRGFGSMATNSNRLLRSYMVIESDYEIGIAIHLYRRVYEELQRLDLLRDTLILATGSRSVHFIIPFEMEKYLTPDQQELLNSARTYNTTLYHWLQMKARKQFLFDTLKLGDLARLVDTHVSLDLLRQIPVPFTFYHGARKFITPISSEHLFCTQSIQAIFAKCSLLPTDSQGHADLDRKLKYEMEFMESTQGDQALAIAPDR
jgi:hypothetical protein